MSRTRWSYREEVSKHLLASIEESREQNLKLLAPEPPKVEFYDPAYANYNDPALTERMTAAPRRRLGGERPPRCSSWARWTRQGTR